MASCSSDEPGKGQDENDGGELQYLAIKIVTSDSQNSRAQTNFEDGSGNENNVKTIRFYFFDESGAAVIVKKNRGNNTYDVTTGIEEDVEDPESDNIEKVLKAVLIIDTKAGDKLPAQVVAVINPKYDAQNLSLSDLRTKSYNYAAEANKNNEDSFTMSNSVYTTTDHSTIIKAVPISINDIKGDRTVAENNPIEIHIERTVAKVRAYLSGTITTTADGYIRAKEKKNDTDTDISIRETPTEGTTTETSTDVYIKILGWNVTSFTDRGYISKRINNAWDASALLGYDWNSFDRKRSYWAAYCTDARNGYIDFNNISETNKFTLTDGTVSAGTEKGLGKKLATKPTDNTPIPCVYTNENAERQTTPTISIKETKIIVAAQLCDAGGKGLTVCEFLGSRMIGQENLKKQMLSLLRTTADSNGKRHTHYKKNSDGTFSEIHTGDITFVHSNYPDPVEDTDTKRYPVKAVLTSAAEKEEWYTWTKDTEPTSTNALDESMKTTYTEINSHLAQLGNAKIYNNGLTYYYASIEHEPTSSTAKYGVVRNHIYEICVDGFYGLGTPVYDPGKVIIPEDPNDTQGYLAAQIKILSWALKTQHVTFGK